MNDLTGTDWPREECRVNGCSGCFGMLMQCGHSFACVHDPELRKHRCGASLTPVLWSLCIGLFVAVLIWSIR